MAPHRKRSICSAWRRYADEGVIRRPIQDPLEANIAHWVAPQTLEFSLGYLMLIMMHRLIFIGSAAGWGWFQVLT